MNIKVIFILVVVTHLSAIKTIKSMTISKSTFEPWTWIETQEKQR